MHQVISAFCVFRTANRHTFGAIFGRDLLDRPPRALAPMLGDMVVAYLTARADAAFAGLPTSAASTDRTTADSAAPA